MSILGFPRTSYQNRSIFYSDVESLLIPGFLSHPVYFKGHIYHLRSLTPTDFYNSSNRIKNPPTERAWKISIVASAIWNVDGISLLEFPHPTLYQRKIFNFLKKIPDSILNKFLKIVLALLNRARRAEIDIEPFCHEEQSFLLWKQSNRDVFNLSGVVGVRDSLGLNVIQRIWTFYNQIEEVREEQTLQWNHAKFIASSMSPDGVKKLQQREAEREQIEEDRRRDLLDFFYYKKVGLAKDGDVDRKTEIHGIRQAYSVEELDEEYRRWVSGEQDEHDRIVEEYKKSIIKRYEEEKKKREEDLQDLRDQIAEKEKVQGSTTLVGMKPEEISDYLGSQPKIRKVFEHDPFARQAMLKSKYLDKKQDAPGFEVKDGKLVSKANLTEEQQKALLQPMVKPKEG